MLVHASGRSWSTSSGGMRDEFGHDAAPAHRLDCLDSSPIPPLASPALEHRSCVQAALVALHDRHCGRGTRVGHVNDTPSDDDDEDDDDEEEEEEEGHDSVWR
jgi:hypothetical protein